MRARHGRDRQTFALIVTPALAGYAVVGALVASRQPRNAIGWLLLAIAILFSLSNVVEALATRSGAPRRASSCGSTTG